ncbi:MAG: hypothetical protein IV100_01155 [Myxococcales bacterium]|nr:hypothetical protein [Myxococcales bacterium]
MSRRTGLTITLDVDPPALSLGGDAATTVFRIVQEALTNVVRHANASRAEVLIHLAGSRLVLEVQDDGVGISDLAQRSAGFGMVGIRERVDTVGGDASWSTVVTGGTLLRVTAPYPVVAVESKFEPE